jgi:inhibitor of cysteine peptidase
MNKIFTLCLTVAVTATLGAGHVASLGNRAQQSDSKRNADFTDPTRPVAVTSGETFVIVMASNRTTGYTWHVAKPWDEKIVKFVSSDYVSLRPDLDGAGGKEIWTFTALTPGQTTIALHYIRPWERDKPPAKEAAFTIIVQ